MSWYKKAQVNIDEVINKYPVANGVSGNLIVRKDVPNMSSISSSLNNFYTVPNVRNVPMSEFSLTGSSYSPEEDARIKRLEEQIKASMEINPLIVVIDDKGPYILEGGHRADALYNLGAKFIPAKIVIDLEANNELV